MSFHLSCEGLGVENRDGATYLVASARREDNSLHKTELRLDDFLGNEDGCFRWDGQNFTKTAEGITFSIEGGGSVPVLRARLKSEGGALQDANVNLSERIENLNGGLVFQ